MAEDTDNVMLTTVDNPWNPFLNYDEWYSFDQAKGYDTPGYLARIVNTSLDLSDADYELSISQAIDEICNLNIRGIYMKAYPPANSSEASALTG